MRIDELFEIKSGIASSTTEVLPHKEAGCIPFIRPASTQQRTLAGWVKRDEVDLNNIYPIGSLFVSTNGEGSHSYSYVSSFEFVPNSDVSVLISKNKEMTLQEKIYYARCITLNRPKFSYGRKPKGARLKSIELPDTLPNWVKSSDVDPFNDAVSPAFNLPTSALNTSNWKSFEYQELFEIERGESFYLKDIKEGKFPYISASAKNNGVTSYVSIKNQDGNAISLAYDGSVGEAFYQPTPFLASEKIAVLRINKTWSKELNPSIALFLITLIRKEKVRYNYGLKWSINSRLLTSLIKLPVTPHGKPDWQFMENYIKTLPYSSQI